MNKWMIVLKASGAAFMLSAVKYVLHYYGLEFIQVNSLISPLISGVIFTLAVLLGGVMTDFKESEKIPGELSASIKALIKDFEAVKPLAGKKAGEALEHASELVSAIIGQFEANEWKQTKISAVVEKIDACVAAMAAGNLAPAYVIKMRNELNSIERLSNRVDTIAETSFLPAAYVLSQTAIALVTAVLLFTAVDPYLIGLCIIFAVSFLVFGILLLIRDMDNPFEYGGKGSADVDLSHIYKLEKFVNNKKESAL